MYIHIYDNEIFFIDIIIILVYVIGLKEKMSRMDQSNNNFYAHL
jgi:hypothetical protein